MNDVVLQQPLRECALFAGSGGGILGGHLLGWRTVVAVEFAAHPRSALLARQRDGHLPSFPIWDDVRTFDGNPWRGAVDIVTGGFPCQDISIAGKGDGLDGERSGLWTEMARIIGQIEPAFVFVENSPMLTSRGLHRVWADLAALGYDAEWGVLGAIHAGAPHERERIWVVAHSNGARLEEHGELLTTVPERPSATTSDQEPEEANRYATDVAYAKSRNAGKQGERERWENTGGGGEDCGGVEGAREICGEEWWSTEPDVGRVADGVAARVDRLSALGNGQVPQVMAMAFCILHERLSKRVGNGA